ncbi:MaoC family dehydratase [Streptomyces sp. NRRL WC-3742]|uniref:MaoC family dehydratase n=1 Tax=Streptomyces sp. NRRL WC-3742 TaxID=1463934 RepID=UPI00099E0E6E|nr:MaoC family dehydratase [Streptomyces sp. NRRL WC-3742]
MTTFPSVEEFTAATGEHLGHSDWVEITQEMVDRYGAVVGDEQWIHTDTERAAEGPFGGTVAHGYLTLSLLSAMTETILTIDGTQHMINVGLDSVRFQRPVRVGKRIRAGATLTSARKLPSGCLFGLRMEVEVEGEPGVACVAETRSLAVPWP